MQNCIGSVGSDVEARLEELSEDDAGPVWGPDPDPELYTLYPRPNNASLYSLLYRLNRFYHEELKQSLDRQSEASTTSYLLSKLVQRGRYNQVVVTLNPVGEGFSVSYHLASGKIIEKEAKYSYTQDALLDYVDKGQLPTPYVEYWEECIPQFFYDGCIICQVRDLRHGPPAIVNYVLLRPHNHSLVGDINKLLTEAEDLKPKDQFRVESYVINNAHRSLCLDPRPATGRRLIKSYQDIHAFDTTAIRKLIYRNSPLVQYRKRKYEHLLPRNNKFLGDFIAAKRAYAEKEKEEVSSPLKQWTVAESQLNMPSYLSPREACKCVKCRLVGAGLRGLLPCGVCRVGDICRCTEYDADDFSPRVLTEWILENQVETTTRHVRLTIMHRPVNYEYLAMIYMDNKYVEGISNGTSCRFSLGSRDHAHRFVKQYIELYTAEGRQKVNITQLGPGHIVK